MLVNESSCFAGSNTKIRECQHNIMVRIITKQLFEITMEKAKICCVLVENTKTTVKKKQVHRFDHVKINYIFIQY